MAQTLLHDVMLVLSFGTAFVMFATIAGTAKVDSAASSQPHLPFKGS